VTGLFPFFFEALEDRNQARNALEKIDPEAARKAGVPGP
jgi:hypothetical protein